MGGFSLNLNPNVNSPIAPMGGPIMGNGGMPLGPASPAGPIGQAGGPAPMMNSASPAGGGGGNMNMPAGMFGQNGMQGQGFGGFNAQLANQGQGQGGGWLQQLMGLFSGQGQQSQGMSPNQALGSLSGQMGYLSNIAGGQGAGAPISQLPAWQAMNQAEQYNIKAGADNLAEQFNNAGGLFSTAYGSAAGQYQEQATLGQNAQLTAAQTAAMQQANQNQLAAGQQLSSQGYGALGTLSGQQYGAAQNAAGLAAGGLNSGINANQAYNTGNYQNQMMGNTLGGSQLLANQNQLTSAYQNWLYSQPQNNPLLSLMYGSANSYPAVEQQTYQPGMLGSLLGGAGSLLGGAGAAGGSAGLAGLLALI